MKEFLKNKTVTHNLMSFTGYKILLIFTLLIDNPKTYEELQEDFRRHELLQEEISKDTLRIYLNSLEQFGCKIEKITKNRITKYYISEHPFQLKITDKQIKSLIKVYKAVTKNIEVSDLISLHNFAQRILPYIDDESLKNKLIKASPLFRIAPEIVDLLLKATENKSKVTLYYNSANSGKKIITVYADNLYVANNILYFSGYNQEHQNYYKFPVIKIIQLVRIEENDKIENLEICTIRYQYVSVQDFGFEPLKNEKIIKEENSTYLVEISSKNKFEIAQRILSLSPNCKVIEPQTFKEEIVTILRKMKDVYYEK